MAANALEECQQDDLRRHLLRCPGCREYWESLAKLTERLITAESLSLSDVFTVTEQTGLTGLRTLLDTHQITYTLIGEGTTNGQAA